MTGYKPADFFNEVCQCAELHEKRSSSVDVKTPGKGANSLKNTASADWSCSRLSSLVMPSAESRASSTMSRHCSSRVRAVWPLASHLAMFARGISSSSGSASILSATHRNTSADTSSPVRRRAGRVAGEVLMMGNMPSFAQRCEWKSCLETSQFARFRNSTSHVLNLNLSNQTDAANCAILRWGEGWCAHQDSNLKPSDP